MDSFSTPINNRIQFSDRLHLILKSQLQSPLNNCGRSGNAFLQMCFLHRYCRTFIGLLHVVLFYNDTIHGRFRILEAPNDFFRREPIANSFNYCDSFYRRNFEFTFFWNLAWHPVYMNTLCSSYIFVFSLLY